MSDTGDWVETRLKRHPDNVVPESPKRKSAPRMDSEEKAMALIARTLRSLDEPTQRRVAWWAYDKFYVVKTND